MATLEDDYGVEVLHRLGHDRDEPGRHHLQDFPDQTRAFVQGRRDRKVKQGRAVFGVEIGIRDGDNNDLPHDGQAFGDLLIRGPVDRALLLQDGG